MYVMCNEKISFYFSFILMSQSLPKELKKTRNMRGDKEVGVTSISFNCENKESFIVGSEPGALFKCSMHAHGEPAGSKYMYHSRAISLETII
jgi:hypothetical protein